MADRPRKLIIHAGMHKTGSTAIQHWLNKKKQPAAHYFEWRNPNHSILFVLLFQENPHTYFSIASDGYTLEQALKEREIEKEKIRKQVEESDKELFIFSAERISSAPDDAVEAMHAFFSELFDDIQVYAYVRKPSGFMTSMFQQHLKTGKIKLHFGKLWPDYRRRFERLVRIFGDENVHLRSFDKLAETKTEVVSDFADWIGLQGAPKREILRNKSMTATGMSLLYFYRKKIEPEVPPENKKDYNERVLDAVQKLPGEKFQIVLDPGKRLRKKFVLDLDWISGRLGEDFNDIGAVRDDRLVFRNDAEILKYATSMSHFLLPEADAEELDPQAWSSMRTTVDRFGVLLSDEFGGWAKLRRWWKAVRRA